MDDSKQVQCPYCGEWIELWIPSDAEGEFIEDCEVCCRPWQVRVRTLGSHREVTIRRC